jgi:putative membrane protein
MIDNFRDHAANERTYLAWIRTAIALMAFGFVIEKFDLFLRYLTTATNVHTRISGQHAKGAGLILIAAGLVLVALATWGFLRNRRLIDGAEHLIYRGTWINLALGGTVATMGAVLMVYVAWAVL